MNEIPKSSPDTQFPVADAMLEIAAEETKALDAEQTTKEAFEAFRRGELSEYEYETISEKLTFNKALAEQAIKRATERVNNDGVLLTPAQRLAGWLMRRRG